MQFDRFMYTFAFFGALASCAAAAPSIEYVQISQRPGTKWLDIEYRVLNPDGEPTTVEFVGRDRSRGTEVPMRSMTGDGVGGIPVNPGIHHAVWDAGRDWGGNVTTDFAVTVRVLADGQPLPAGVVFVQGGTFTMGDPETIGFADERPPHAVTVDAFLMAKFEVTNLEMASVLQWAVDNMAVTVEDGKLRNRQGDGQVLYDLDAPASRLRFSGGVFSVTAGNESDPCQSVSWYGAVAYCNYRSAMEGRSPRYDMSDWSCDWSKDGYRLPTEAEWEYAARGGAFAEDTICSGSDDAGSVSWYADNSAGRAHAVGTKAANEIGLYDMSGNVSEWCWDRYAETYYQVSSAIDPRGPDNGIYRVVRGSNYTSGITDSRLSRRGYKVPAYLDGTLGFRIVLGGAGK